MAQIKQKERNVKRKTMFVAQNGLLSGTLRAFFLPVRKKTVLWGVITSRILIFWLYVLLFWL